MEEEKGAFYIVRKGGVVGIYKSLSDCQDQAGAWVDDPSISVFKGYGLSKEAEYHLVTFGLKNACYSLNVADVRNDLFEDLVPCPFQQPFPSRGKSSEKASSLPAALRQGSKSVEVASAALPTHPETSRFKSESSLAAPKTDCVDDPFISVFKGYGLSKEAEKNLVTLGLKNACYSLNVADVQNDLFEDLVPCPFQQPFPSRGKSPQKVSSLPAGLQQGSKSVEVASAALPTHPETSRFKSESSVSAPKTNCGTCALEFDGASRGNPGPAGAGAVLRALNGSVVYHLREGLGTATNNVAEYRALILGLKHALKEGFRNISVYGDSNLVCMQVQGLWNVKNPNLAVLCKEARELKDKFNEFTIKYIPRAQNSDADAQANLAVSLRDGQVEADCPSQTTDKIIQRIGAYGVLYPGDV